MNKKHKNEITFAQNFFTSLESKHLLLDTSVFIDASRYKPTFQDFFLKCKKNNVTLVTIDPVKIEFTRGSENKTKLEVKKQFINSIVGFTLPIAQSIFNKTIPELIQSYQEIGKSISLTDLILAATTVNHSHDLYLLTKNPKDFPRSVFNLNTHMVIDLKRELQVYAVLSGQK